jgi:hypothetical protein
VAGTEKEPVVYLTKMGRFTSTTIGSKLYSGINDGVFVVQAGLGVVTVHFSGTLLWPADTFSTSQSFRWFAMVANEDTWGCIFTIPAILCFLGLIVERRWIQIGSAFVTAFVFGLLSFGFYTGNPQGTGWGTYMILLGLSYWVLWMRLRAEY